VLLLAVVSLSKVDWSQYSFALLPLLGSITSISGLISPLATPVAIC
jgi:hypothetical protein